MSAALAIVADGPKLLIILATVRRCSSSMV
jgi:hypothetical protein